MKTPCSVTPPSAGPLGLKRLPLLLPLALLGLTLASPQADALSIDLDTSALSGIAARLEFVLYDGDLTDNNHATIASLATDATGTLQTHDCSLSCIESAGSYTLADTGGLGQFLQDLTLGNSLHFGLSLSNAFAGGELDRLVVSLLDPATNFVLVSTDLNLTDAISVQDALLTVDFSGGAGYLLRQATATTPAVGISVVPSPAPLSLMLPWAFWLAGQGRTARPKGSSSLESLPTVAKPRTNNL